MKHKLVLYPLILFLLPALQGCGGLSLFTAAGKNDVTEVRRLLTSGANPNFRNVPGKTPLHHAAYNGSFDAVVILTANGADVLAVDRAGNTTLMDAMHSGKEEIASLLVAKGVDVNATNAQGDTALGLAAVRGHVQIVELLIANNAHVNMPNKLGETPLWRAAAGGHLKVAERLISSGADVNASNAKGETPLMMAAGNNGIRELLILNGAGVEKRQLDYLLAEMVVRMAPPTELKIDPRTGQPHLIEWDPEKSQALWMPKISKLILLGADPNALRIKDYQPARHHFRKEPKAEYSLFLGGTPGLVVPFNEGGQSIVEFCNEWHLTKAQAVLDVPTQAR